MIRYWVISESLDREDGVRWKAYPATEETLEDIKKIAGLFKSNIIVTQEVK